MASFSPAQPRRAKTRLAPGFILASLRGSTYAKKSALPPRSLRPRLWNGAAWEIDCKAIGGSGRVETFAAGGRVRWVHATSRRREGGRVRWAAFLDIRLLNDIELDAQLLQLIGSDR
jgi:hypothetical protein